MSGQQQIIKLDADRLYAEALKTMLTQADLWYAAEKFKIKSKYDSTRMLHAVLFEDILCTDSCDLLKWIQKKISGRLELEDLQIVDLKTLQTKRPDINITNIYNTDQTWDNASW